LKIYTKEQEFQILLSGGLSSALFIAASSVLAVMEFLFICRNTVAEIIN